MIREPGNESHHDKGDCRFTPARKRCWSPAFRRHELTELHELTDERRPVMEMPATLSA